MVHNTDTPHLKATSHHLHWLRLNPLLPPPPPPPPPIPFCHCFSDTVFTVACICIFFDKTQHKFLSIDSQEWRKFQWAMERERDRDKDRDTETQRERETFTPNLHFADINEVTVRSSLLSLSLKLDHLTNERRAAGHVKLRLSWTVRVVGESVTQLTVHVQLAFCQTFLKTCKREREKKKQKILGTIMYANGKYVYSNIHKVKSLNNNTPSEVSLASNTSATAAGLVSPQPRCAFLAIEPVSGCTDDSRGGSALCAREREREIANSRYENGC